MSEITAAIKATVALLIVGIIGAAAVSYTWSNTAQRIEINEREYRLRALNQIVDPTRYTNAFFDDTITVSNADLLGTDEALTVYRARDGSEPVAVVLNVVAPDGYSGPIRLLVGIDYDGTLAGVRVASHRETAGLGDKIEVEKSDWIKQFEDRSLGNPPLPEWNVKSEGGVFDQFTGATVTPRAVVTAVRDALIYFNEHRNQLFAAAGNAGVNQPDVNQP